ncbi:MAG: class I SAM-dependent methyltransferase [Anaerolineae bacterium]
MRPRTQRVLLVTPAWKGSLGFFCRRAFEQIGYQVRVFDYRREALGEGYDSAAVAPQNRPVGLEISWGQARHAADKGISVPQANSEQLPFANSSFHLVLLIGVIEHVWRPDAVIADIARIPQPESRLILTTPNYPVKREYDWLKCLQGVHSLPADDPTHFSPFSVRRLRRLCSRYFATVESRIHHIAGEGRGPALARLRRSTGIGDWIGHKVMLSYQHPRSCVA